MQPSLSSLLWTCYQPMLFLSTCCYHSPHLLLSLVWNHLLRYSLSLRPICSKWQLYLPILQHKLCNLFRNIYKLSDLHLHQYHQHSVPPSKQMCSDLSWRLLAQQYCPTRPPMLSLPLILYSLFWTIQYLMHSLQQPNFTSGDLLQR